jgi:UDP-N-acetylglucosamine acyltransferase
MIHPTAIVEKGAQLDEGVEVGAYAYVGPKVRLGKGTVIRHHATVEGYTEMGRNNTVFPYAFVGAMTQDLKFKGGQPGLKVGEGNCFREYCSIHVATEDGRFTVIGSHNNFLAYTHVAHDCILGDNIITSNYCGIAGHVRIGNYVVMGGYAGVHQFCRIGDYAMLGGMAKVVQDVAPFVIVEGNPAKTRTLNKVGLERHNFDASSINQIKTAYKILFKSDLTREKAIEVLREENEDDTPLLAQILAFVEQSDRGIC